MTIIIEVNVFQIKVRFKFRQQTNLNLKTINFEIIDVY
jgi:hypothetical protein